jgi:transcriptional regulator with XRE-family HTH domain
VNHDTECWNYRTMIRDRLKALREKQPGFTLGRFAEKLGLEASYLSRVLNDVRFQFSEDQLWRILENLGFPEWEIDHALLLRSHETTGLASRREALARKIRFHRKVRGYVDLDNVRADLERMSRLIESLKT